MHTLTASRVAQLGFLLCLPHHTAAFSIDPKVSLGERQQSGGCTEITPSSPASVCAATGHLKKPRPLSAPQRYGTYQKCRDSCARSTFFEANGTNHGGCNSFSFSKDTGKCILHHKRVERLGFQQDPSDATQFWDIDCFKCPATCPQPLNVNLIQNGGFESPGLGPWKRDRFTAGHIVSPGFKSPHAYRGLEILQTIVTCQDSFYRVSMNVKGARGTNAGYFLSFGGQAVRATGKWQYLEAYYQAPRSEASTFDVYIYSFGSDEGYLVDNVDIRRVPWSFSTASGATELIANGGFETGEIAPWFTADPVPYAEFDIVQPGIQSKYALRYTGSSGGFALFQNVLVEPGKRYLFQFTSTKTGESSSHPDARFGGIYNILPFHRLDAPRLDFALPFYATERNVSIYFDFFHGPSTIDNISLKELA